MRARLAAEPFVADGMAWRIHRERVLLAGWGRAILLQLAHPKVARGVAEHSGFATEPWGRLRRLRRTLHTMLALTFESEEASASAVARINAIHDRVHGRLDEPAGGAAAGASYSAHDPELLTWVHATLIESFLLTYRLFVRPVTPAEADRYCAEASGIERALGIPPGRLPRTETELRDYLAAMLASGAIEVTDTARRLSRDIIAPPVPRGVGPAVWLAALPAVGLLPPAIRAAYGLRWDGRRERLLRIMATAARGGLPLVPPALRYWAVARRAQRRLRG
ncbi:MAG: oxygenase MpaB family protein [Candidatus Rokuibacteriota bacterium]